MKETVELMGALLTFFVTLFIFITAVVVASFYALDRPSCYAQGEKMKIETEWSFDTKCMIKVRNQWLPWSEVVPVERNGTIVFEPKPHVRLAPPAR